MLDGSGLLFPAGPGRARAVGFNAAQRGTRRANRIRRRISANESQRDQRRSPAAPRRAVSSSVLCRRTKAFEATRRNGCVCEASSSDCDCRTRLAQRFGRSPSVLMPARCLRGVDSVEVVYCSFPRRIPRTASADGSPAGPFTPTDTITPGWFQKLIADSRHMPRGRFGDDAVYLTA